MLVKIVKNKRIVDKNNEFTYVLECHHGNQINKTTIKVPANEYMLPDETVVNASNNREILVSWLQQLNYQYDDIDLNNFTVIEEEI